MNLLVDGNSIFNIAYHAMLKEGEEPRYVALNLILSVMEKHRPNQFERIAICWDSIISFRKMLYPKYKGNRKEKPAEYQKYITDTALLFRGVGLYNLSDAGYEADDIIAGLSAEPGHHLIYSGDRDLMQLVEYGRVSLLYTRWSKANGRELLFIETNEQVKEVAGAVPSQLADYKALVGDSSDNIPGIRGIGPAAAKKLLGPTGKIEDIYFSGHVYLSQRNSKMVEKVKSNIAEAFLFRTLVTLYGTSLNTKNRDLIAPTVEEIHERVTTLKETANGTKS